MASIFDILKNTDFSSALDMLANQAKGAARTMQQNTPGGLGGLLGAGALGAVLGNVMNSNLVKGVAMAGASAVAYNFYKKWVENQGQAQAATPGAAQRPVKNQFGPGFDTEAPGASASLDPTAELVARSMNYAARADGNIDEIERQRMREILKNVLPGKNVEVVIDAISKEPIDPERIAASTISADQAEDVYRLSCATVDVDQYMEKNYLEALANSLGISQNRKKELETEAITAKQHLMNAISA